MAIRDAILYLLLVGNFVAIRAETQFERYFKEQSLRVDFVLAGDAQTNAAYLDKLVKEPHWGGRKSRLDEFHGKGTYQFQLTDAATGILLYTDGFCALFEEWQTTVDAHTSQRAFHQSVTLPLPKQNCTFVLLKREKGLFADTLMSLAINPASASIRTATLPDFEVRDLHISDAPDRAIDIVLLAEGYTRDDRQQFYEDAKKFAASLQKSAVFQDNFGRLNIRAVAAESKDAGCDDPLKNRWKETCFNSSFYTIGIGRYLMTSDAYTIRNVAAMVPYDQIFVLVNTPEYGGGGIFNSLGLSGAQSRHFEEVIVHELGHSFAGLGDEYVNSDNIWMPDLSVEPWEANLTLFNGNSIKWQSLIQPGTPLPTPDSLGLKRKQMVGLFEGGGYVQQGIYRPSHNCRMRSNEAKDFCKVCSQAIQEMFDFYTQP